MVDALNPRAYPVARTGVSSEVTRVWCSHLFSWVPKDLPYSQVTSWQCGFLGTRGGEASHPGPSDICGATLLEANPLPDQDFPDATHNAPDVSHDAGPVTSVAVAPPGSCPPLRNSPAPRSPGFRPVFAVYASGSLIWSLVLPSSVVPGPLPSYQPWMEFVRRHDLPLEWLQSVGLQQDSLLQISW